MAVALMVPVHLDALWLDGALSVVESMADFSRLPYTDSQGDVNPARPNISEQILSVPLADRAFQLKTGVHLHWALPDVLTRGRSEGGQIHFPAVPNRWLVSRRRGGAVDRRWVVESDYLFPAGSDAGSITYPYADATDPRPYRRLGRQLPFAAWQQANAQPTPGAAYLPLLTAVGYGEPNFASFYPNCHSVFGFYDPAPPDRSEEVSYDVVGWYGDPAQDILATLLGGAAGDGSGDGRGWLTQLQAAGWTVESGAGDGPPTRSLCYARLQFAVDADPSRGERHASPAVALGNTSTEALSVYLAQTLAPGQRHIVEEQLEALHLGAGLHQQQLDLGFKFREARHEKGFTAAPGGSLWTIRPEVAPGGEDHTTHAPAVEQATLPDHLAHLLNRLNGLQQAYDRALVTVDALRRNLFADWYKYMLSAYPPDGTLDAYPDPGAVSHFIRRHALRPLKQKVAETGELLLVQDRQTGAVFGADARGWGSSLAHDLATAVNEVAAALPEVQLLTPADIRDWAGFQKVMQERLGTLLVDEEQVWQLLLWEEGELRLGSLTLPEMRALLDHSFLLAEERALLLDALNTLIRAPEMTLGTPFRGLTPPPEAVALSQQPGVWTQARRWRYHRLYMEALFPEHIARRPNFRLQQVLAPRYWRPNNPVVLLAGEAARSSERHGEDGRLHPEGLLECTLLSFDGPLPSQWQAVDEAVDRLAPRPGQARIGFSRWTEPPWHPIMLEWQVELFPSKPRLLRISLADTTGLDQESVPGAVRAAFVHRGMPLPDEVAVVMRIKGLEWLLFDPAAPGREYLLRANGGQLDIYDARPYGPNMVTASYQLSENDVDPAPRPGQAVLRQRADVYTGRSILTPHARTQLAQQIAGYLESLAPDDFYPPGTPPGVDEGYRASLQQWYDQQYPLALASVDDWPALIRWYEEKPLPGEQGPFSSLPDAQKWQDPAYTAARAYAHLQELPLLAQSLGGFNEALLMHKQSLQLPVADPLGFADERLFTQAVAAAIQGRNRSAPQPLAGFNPIRTGVLKLHRLRLVDNFGRTQEVASEQPIASEVLATPAHPHLLSLPPRLAQPARLNFRWLAAASAGADEAEANAHPAMTPVCGWLLPNNLDGSLMVYGGQGQALGSISPAARWQSAPGRAPLAPWNIRNRHLRQLVGYLLAQGEAFFGQFLAVVERSLEAIDPEATEHAALSLLVGRPLAVVRAALSLEVQGPPATDQSWNAFQRRMAAGTSGSTPAARDSGHFGNVRFPIRLGEYHQLNDGLVGYWLEGERGDYRDARFYAPQTPADAEMALVLAENIWIHRPGRPLNISLALADTPQKATMLVDPRGAVHATSGILPTKAIRIPADQFTSALQAIEVTFLTAPVLSPQEEHGGIRLTLPVEGNLRWSWVEKRNGEWRAEAPLIPIDDRAVFAPGQAIREGWLKLSHTEEDEYG